MNSSLLISGSDFASGQFSPEENKQWAKLLVQLRSFEAEVCHTIRNIEKKLTDQEKTLADQAGSSKPSETLGVILEGKFYPTLLEGKIEMLEDMLRLINKDFDEKYNFIGADLDVTREKVDELEKTTRTLQTEIDSLPPLEMSVRLLESDMTQVQGLMRTMGEAIENAEEDIGNNKARIEALENGNEFLWNGHSQVGLNESFHLEDEQGEEKEDRHTNRTHDIENPLANGFLDHPGGENNNNNPPHDPNQNNECELMTMDPFLNNGLQVGTYDGNPTISFSNWSQRFQDVISLMKLTEEQKLSRLKICLVGRARAEFEMLNPKPTNLNATINALKGKFENSNTRSIAKQALSICKQAPGEKIYNFAN